VSHHDPLEFTLLDADGAEHKYVVTPHRPQAGMRIVHQLFAVFAPSLLALIPPGMISALKSGRGAGELLAQIDLAAAGPALSIALGSLPADIEAAILAETTRDGKALKNPANFDAAYARNYWEALQAVQKVTVYNGFFGPLATFIAGQAKSASATPSLPG
jgi:hypothetical protein